MGPSACSFDVKRAHHVGDADIALEAAHQPVHAIEILIPAERGQERLRAGIVVGIAARLALSRPVIFLG
jgi:hypothetical protein